MLLIFARGNGTMDEEILHEILVFCGKLELILSELVGYTLAFYINL